MVGAPGRNLNIFDSDYLSHFGLTTRPFGLTPDPAFHFPSASHRKAFDVLNSFILKDHPVALVFGEVGTGKTILCKHFMSSLDEAHFNAGLLTNPIMGEKGSLSEAIARSFGLKPKFDGDDYGKALRERLSSNSHSGKRTILAIDEAQALSGPMLQFLVGLAHEAAVTSPALQIILFAQREIVESLLDPAMKTVRRAITTTQFLNPLTLEEVAGYVEHRLTVAGSQGQIRFTRDALRILFDCSEGFPRIINNLCDRSLLVLSSRSESVVDRKVMKRVLRAFEMSSYS